jgi:hypothetical protein
MALFYFIQKLSALIGTQALEVVADTFGIDDLVHERRG